MTTHKLRVKDLAEELNIGPKDLLQTLKDLGIQATSLMSALSDEDAADARAKLRDHGSFTEVVRQEIQPGMIVRRRRKTVPATAEAAAEPEAPHEAVPTPATPTAPAVGDVQATAAGDAPAAPVSADAKPDREAPSRERQRKPHVETPRARVISPPAKAAPAPVEEDEPVEAALAAPLEAAASEDRTVVQAKDQTPPAAVGESAETADDDASGEDAEEGDGEDSGEVVLGEDGLPKKSKKKRKKRKEFPVGPQVKVISMPLPQPPAQKPAPTAAPAATPPSSARPATGTDAQRPGRPPRSPRPGESAPRPGERPPFGARPAQPDPTIDPATGKKKLKIDRRVVEFAPTVSEDENRRHATLQIKKKKSAGVKDKTGGKVRSGRRRRGPFDTEMEDGSAQAADMHPIKAAKRKLRIDEAIRVSDMAHQMGVKAQAVIKILLGLGIMATINQAMDLETTTLVAAEFGYEVEKIGFSEEDYLIPKETDLPESLKPRPPVVTIMGHVDHGKTSLLDAIRETNVTKGEAGGITQHIGAYHVATNRGEIVFLDTPGHEAFTAMRARGAQVTDLVVLVVAADDGVMDQTREAVNHSRAAGVPILVAVNKIDKAGADPDRVKRELADLGLLPEDWGGTTIYANVSAKARVGLDELLELILLQAEVLELKANPDKLARGHIIEAKVDKGRGAVATVLIQEGTLRAGDNFVCGLFNGRVRALFNDQGKKVKEAGPAMPVEVQGLEGVPEAGDEFASVADDKVARRIAEARQMKRREKDLAKESKVTLETFLARRVDKEEIRILNLILKTDVQGSLEAVIEALNKLSTDEVRVRIIHGGAGAITESDILLASASEAIIIGFNVRPAIKVKEIAEREKVDIRFYDIIYKLVGEIKDAMSGMLSPTIREVYLGQAEVRNVFSVPRIGAVAGCAVVDGKILRNTGVRLLRDGVVIYTGQVSSLKRFKDDAKEVLKGYECGIGLEKFNDIKVGDIIEAFEEVSEARTL